MGFIACEYDSDKDGGTGRLHFWLALDKWKLTEAAYLFSNIDPDSVEDEFGLTEFESLNGEMNSIYDSEETGFPIPSDFSREGEKQYIAKYKGHYLRIMQKIFNDRCRLIERLNCATPHEWVDLAIEKKINIPWLDWAIERGLYKPQQTIDNLAQPEAQSSVSSTPQGSKWRKAFEYESKGLNALYDLIERHFFDANGNPIYDPAEWPLKKNLESDWLTGRNLGEADTIITSRKRKGKAEK